MLMDARERTWEKMSLEEKVDNLRSDVGKLFTIDEGFENQNHVFLEAIQLVHQKLDTLSQEVQTLRKNLK